MGVKAIDDINRRLTEAIYYLKQGRLSKEIIHLKYKDADAVLYTLQKASDELRYLSENIYSRGYGDKSLLGRLKQAFQGLFGGF